MKYNESHQMTRSQPGIEAITCCTIACAACNTGTTPNIYDTCAPVMCDIVIGTTMTDSSDTNAAPNCIAAATCNTDTISNNCMSPLALPIIRRTG